MEILFGFDICIIVRVELLPEVRVRSLGKRILKDIITNFSSGCQIFVAQAFPLQFEAKMVLDANKDWYKKMGIGDLEKDFEKAFYQLKGFYQTAAFVHIKGYKELMFLNPSLRSPLNG